MFQGIGGKHEITFSPTNPAVHDIQERTMITKLTKEQELQIPKTIEKWVNQASTPMDHKKAIEYTKKLYKSMNQEEPLIIFGFSPMNTVLLTELFFKMIKEEKDLLKKFSSQLGSQLDIQLDIQLDNQLRSQLDSQLDIQLGSQLYNQLDSQLGSQLDIQLDSQLGSQLGSQLRSQLGSQLDNQLDSQLRSQLDNQLYNQLDSQPNNEILKSIQNTWYLGVFWLIWCGWYEYGQSIGVKFDHEKYDLFMNFNSEVNFIIPYKGICFISEKPTEIHWNNGRLHKDGGLAVKYSDGYGLYMLNGVKVPDWLAINSESELTVEQFKSIENADVKAEFIRKFGIQRMLSLGKKIEDCKYHKNEWFRKSEYELYNMGKVFDRETAMFLKMRNLTTGIYHFEGVHPECKTIEDALKYRAKNRVVNLKGVA